MLFRSKQTSTEIADVLAASPSPCVVKIYVLMKDGVIAGDEMKRAVLAACSEDERRPLADLVSVEDAELIPYDVDFTYYIETGATRSAAAVAAAVRKAVDDYNDWQRARLGRDINPSRLHQMLMDAGIKRVELRSPNFTMLHDGKGGAVPQVAKLGSVSIVSGGYEDE